jgi:2-polyprenyl-3-methyl-5-hydroxy-6-metoxy-1,4-benzoquinol methylase
MECPLCHKASFQELLNLEGLAMNSDQSIGNVDLKKGICKGCGLVRAETIDPNALRSYYREDYSFHATSDGEEHIFITDEWAKGRSEFIVESWLIPNLFSAAVRSVLEVGCGKGLVLRLLKARFPNIEIWGLEPSKGCTQLARESGLRVVNEFLDERSLEGYQFDVVFAVGVLEHVSEPFLFIKNLARLCQAKGRVGVIIPNAAFISYDIFFADHLFHFTPYHVAVLMERAGLSVEKVILNQSPLSQFMFAIGFKGDGKSEMYPTGPSKVAESIRSYREVFGFLNGYSAAAAQRRLGVYGMSEVFMLLRTYSERFRDLTPLVYIDDSPLLRCKEIDRNPIRLLTEINLNDVDDIIVTTNKTYYKKIERKLRSNGFSGKIVFPMDFIVKAL